MSTRPGPPTTSARTDDHEIKRRSSWRRVGRRPFVTLREERSRDRSPASFQHDVFARIFDGCFCVHYVYAEKNLEISREMFLRHTASREDEISMFCRYMGDLECSCVVRARIVVVWKARRVRLFARAPSIGRRDVEPRRRGTTATRETATAGTRETATRERWRISKTCSLAGARR